MLARAELGRARAFEPGEVARRLDHRHLHAEADAEIRHLALAREARRLDLAFGAALAEAAGNQDAVHRLEMLHRVALLEDLAVEPVELDPDVIGDAAMAQRLGQRFVAVEEMRVLADDGDGDLAFGAADAGDDLLPAPEIGLGLGDAEMAADLAVEALQVIGVRHVIDGVDVERGNDAAVADIAEERDLLALAFRDRPVGAAEQDVRLDAEAEQLLHRMLRRLGLQLAGRRDVGHQGQMHEHRALAAELVAELADRLEEGQALDVADGAADLAQHEILAAVEIGLDELLDRVGDVRDDLHRGAEIFAAALAADHRRIDPAGGDAVAAPRRDAGVALVMAEIEVGLGAVIGDVDLAMLVGAHRPGIDIEIGIELAQPHREAARLQQRAERRRRKTFAKGGNHAAGNEDEPRHGPSI